MRILGGSRLRQYLNVGSKPFLRLLLFGSLLVRRSLAISLIAALAGCTSNLGTEDDTSSLSEETPLYRTHANLNGWPFGKNEVNYTPVDGKSKAVRILEDIVSQRFTIPKKWQSQIERWSELKPIWQLDLINALVNEMPYRKEKNDIWRHPSVYFSEGGDCDCAAVAKYALLRQQGMDPDRLRLTVVKHIHRSTYHMLLSAKLGEKIFDHYVLDNDGLNVTAMLFSDYIPYVSMNERGVWVHRKMSSAQIESFLDPIYKK